VYAVKLSSLSQAVTPPEFPPAPQLWPALFAISLLICQLFYLHSRRRHRCLLPPPPSLPLPPPRPPGLLYFILFAFVCK